MIQTRSASEGHDLFPLLALRAQYEVPVHPTRQSLEYALDSREFDLAGLNEAIVGFVFSVGPHGDVSHKLDQGKLSIVCDGLSVSAPVKPT